jgi:hypothetical protein
MKNNWFFGGHLLNLFLSSTQSIAFSCVAPLSQIEIYVVFINFDKWELIPGLILFGNNINLGLIHLEK